MFNSYLATTLEYRIEACIGCRKCVEVCPHGVFEIESGKARILRAEGCMECGACKLNCEGQAIRVDSGVGCAAGMMMAALGRKKYASCS